MRAMNNDETEKLCLELLHADTEQDVIALLEKANLWSTPGVWRLYGDRENNFSTIGNQQSRPDAALVEKLINSEDARLMSECMSRGIDPQGPDAPQTIRDAVARFFDEKDPSMSPNAGKIALWGEPKRRKVARGITLSATGASPKSGRPCFTIADSGEGQTPEMMPETLLSLDKSNKLRIPFVQGKFNMGGTGILKFCGRRNLEFVLSKRNPSILRHGGVASDHQWGFTVVRREDPSGFARSSVYTYLAPLESESYPNKGGVLRFTADELPIFPEGNNAYIRNETWGTAIKLYEFGGATSVFSNTHILRKDGLLGRLDLLLAEPALPIRLHECRPSYGGHAGSFDTTLTGLVVRLEDARQENLEDDFPASCPLSVDGENMVATIYAFKKGRAETYRRDEGVVFTVNGQLHGNLTKSFFTRQRAGRLNYIADSLLVIVDCTDISGRAREDLFMNSRDRLSHNPFRQSIEAQLEIMLRENPGLRALKERRRAEEIQSKLAEEKPLEEILEGILRQSPALASLFLTGIRAANPFKTINVAQKEEKFEGKTHPTYFKFKGKDYGKELARECNLEQRCRITFETDAVNDYFKRQINSGSFSLFRVSGEHRSAVSDYVGPLLQNGIAALSMELPVNCQAGDYLEFEAVVADPILMDSFINRFSLNVKPAVIPSGENHGARRKPPAEHPGDERERPSGIAMPHIIPIYEKEWGNYTPPFDKQTALRIGITDEQEPNSSANEDDRHDVFDFKINMDNVFLKTELKNSKNEVELVHKRWQYALVLVGLALLHDDRQQRKDNHGNNNGADSAVRDMEDDEEETENIDDKVARLTIALAPVLLPMIETLGALDIEQAETVSASGEAN
jgi:hypothetical protein